MTHPSDPAANDWSGRRLRRDQPPASGPAEDSEVEQAFLDQAKFVTQRQVYRTKPKRARELINTLLARKGYNQVETSTELQTAWESLLDPRFRNRTRATMIRGGRLEVVVESPLVNQELTFNKSQLISKMKDLPIGRKVRDIRFRVGEI